MIKILNNLIKIKKDGNSIIMFIINRIYFLIKGKNILSNHRSKIYGLQNIFVNGRLVVGITKPKLVHKFDRTFINIEGTLNINGHFDIGRGTRFVIGKDAICNIESGYINSMTNVLIMHGLKIGQNVAISWGCEIIDEDFHEIDYTGKKQRENNIEIGNNVWIGSGVKILKGVKVADGSVIASNSLLVNSFDEKNVLIGGSPAKIIKRNIKWK